MHVYILGEHVEELLTKNYDTFITKDTSTAISAFYR